MTAALDMARLRHGPILSTLLRLSAPNVIAMAMTVLVGIAETYYVGRLGTTPLAALGLVFPFAMLTGTMSAGVTWRVSIPWSVRALRRSVMDGSSW